MMFDGLLLSTCTAFSLTEVLTFVAIVLTLHYALQPYYKYNRGLYPPGPFPLPFIGNSITAFFSPNIGASRWQNWRKYGSIVGYYGIWGWSVDVSSYDTIKRVLTDYAKEFSDRPPVPSKLFGRGGVIFGEPHLWPLLRSHAITVLRDHGIGKMSIESKITAEIERLTAAIEPLTGTIRSSKEIGFYLLMAVSNLSNEVIFGRRLDYSEDLARSIVQIPYYGMSKAKYNRFFIFKLLPWDATGYRNYSKVYEKCRKFFMSEIKKRKQTLDPNDPRDYIESFLARGMKTGEACFKDEVQLISCISQLYIAGSDTMSANLLWALFYLVNNADVQEKIYHEICQVIGSRQVTIEDRKAMPYTQASVWEILRISSIATCALPHWCNDDVVIDGKPVAKDTVAIFNLWSANHDPENFPEPEVFKPERFLNSDGKFESSLTNKALPFGIGKRVCPGAEFAKVMLFMVVTTLIQRFKFCRNQVEKLPFRSYMGLGVECKPFDLIIKSRK